MKRIIALITVCLAALNCGSHDEVLELRPASTEQSIQGGTLDQTDSAVVGIVIVTNQGIAICSGALIGPNLVLTAHHCVSQVSNNTACGSGAFGSQYSTSSFFVTTSTNAPAQYFGTGKIPHVDNSTWFGVSAVHVPGNNICGQDMAVLQLSHAIPSSVCPLVPRVDSAVSKNEGYTAVGYGITSPNGQAAGTRYSAGSLSVLCTSNCGSDMSNTLEWFGGTTAARGTCEGDSGGPAIDANRRVIGTVSRGPANACNQTIYESVYGNAAWLKQEAQAAATAGGYAAAPWVTGASTAAANSGYCTSGGTGGGGTGGGGAGGGGAGTGGGAVGGGTGNGGSSCAAGLSCTDATGQGDFVCLDDTTANGFPSGAASCTSDADCPNGESCWTSGTAHACLRSCVAGGTGTGGGSSGTGGGSGSTSGTCTDTSLSCVDGTGQGDYACVGVAGFPFNAPSCTTSADCPTDYRCWSSASGRRCLQTCSLTGAGGGHAGSGGGAAGGSANTGGGSVGGGNTGTGGGAAGGTTGNAAPDAGTPAGAGGGPTAVDAGVTGSEAASSGCGCTTGSGPASLWLMAMGLVFVRRRRAR